MKLLRHISNVASRTAWTVLSCLAVVTAAAHEHEDDIKTVIKPWVLPHPLALADTVAVDSSFINFAMRDVLYDYSICNVFNGNIVSPVQSAVYFDRTHKTNSIFGDPYDPYTITPQDVRFYNTTTPYSGISYKKGFTSYHEENDLQFFCTGNLTPRVNLGASVNYLNGAGHYQNQEAKTVNGSAFGSFNGDHYSLQAAFTFNTLSNFENGGMSDVNDINSSLEPEDYPMQMKGMSGYRYLSGYLNHYYSLTVQREETVHYRERDESGRWQDLDSVRIIHVPVTTFRHVFDISEVNKRYIEREKQDYYTDSYRNPSATNDSASTLTLRNTLSVTFEEEFNTKLKFGAIVYAYNECQRYLYPEGQNLAIGGTDGIMAPYDSIVAVTVHQMPDSLYRYAWTNSTFVGGELYKNRGRIIHYGFGGQVCVVGYKIGEFKVNGHLDANFRLGKDTMHIGAQASFGRETPDWYVQHYTGNHRRWENSFTDPLRLRVGGNIAYPTTWVKPHLRVDYENLTHAIYFDTNGLPRQAEENISILAAKLGLNITTPWINLDNTAVYQYSSSDKIALPTIALYSNLYYHGLWFRAMEAQIGVDLRYNTAYYAPLLDPSTGQFRMQNETKVGNAPILSVYANFYVHLIRLRFFAQYQHFNATFMTKNYFSMPGYPLNPDIFRAGLAWHFYR